MNPFILYRQRLQSYRQALQRGWTDARFVALVEELDDAVGRVHGHGFLTTPFDAAPALAHAIGLSGNRFWIKDDTGNVGGSHKARHLFGVLLHLAVGDPMDGELAIASCGNAALAAAVVARAAGRGLSVFIPTWADERVVSQLQALGARIVVCERRDGEVGDPTYLRFCEAVDAGAVPFSCQASITPSTLDGGRTLGWELADQLNQHAISGPVHLYVQVGGGALASATWMGLCEGISHVGAAIKPVMHSVQTTACAPLARAWSLLEADSDDPAGRMELARAHPERYMWAWENVGTSAASGILDDVTYDWLGIVEAMANSAGWPVTTPECQVVKAHRLLHTHTAIDADATGSAGLAGVLQDLAQARCTGSEQVVVLVTGLSAGSRTPFASLSDKSV